jgi:regulator of cell morphogenesis and NO signaling
VRNPIRVMMAEHDAAGDALAQIRRLSHDFTPPEGACPTYRGYYHALAEFEQDLHRHVHLENNILFPRAIEMDESCG